MLISLGGVVATAAAISWAVVYGFTQQILKDMTPLNLLTSTYLVAGFISLVPFAIFGDVGNIGQSVKNHPSEFAFYVLMILIAKYLMIVSVNLIGATSAGLIEISYPLWTALLMYLWKGERLDTGLILGGSLIIVGIIIITLSRTTVVQHSLPKLHISKDVNYGAIPSDHGA